VLKSVFGRASELDTMLLNGELDMRIGYPAQSDVNRLAEHELVNETLYMVVPKTLIKNLSLADKTHTFVSIRDFVHHPFLLYPKNLGYRKVIDEYADQNQIHLRVIFEADSSDTLLRMAALGEGITFASNGSLSAYRLYKPDIFESISAFPIKDLDYSRKLTILYQSGRILTAVDLCFIDICEKLYRPQHSQINP